MPGKEARHMYVWTKKFSKPRQQRENESDLQVENARLKRELRRAQQERNILEEAAVFFAGESKNVTRS